jgi:hypothetical protein
MPEFDDVANPKVAAVALMAALVLSKPGRRLLRRGAVYGTAGALMAWDAVTGLGIGVSRGFQDATSRVATTVRRGGSGTQEVTLEG